MSVIPIMFIGVRQGLRRVGSSVASVLCALGMMALLGFALTGFGSRAVHAAMPLAGAQEDVGVAFGHFAPFASSPMSTAVEIRLNGTVVVSEIVFGALTPYLPLPAGDYLVEVIQLGESEPVVTSTLTLSGTSDHTVAIIGNNASRPLAVAQFEDDNVTLPSQGQARLRVAHLAPLPTLIAPPALDLCTEQNTPPLVGNLSYGDSEVVEAPAQVYNTFIATAGTNCALPLVNLPPFTLHEGEIAYAYAVGDGIRAQPTVVFRSNLTVTYSLYLPHLSRE